MVAVVATLNGCVRNETHHRNSIVIRRKSATLRYVYFEVVFLMLTD